MEISLTTNQVLTKSDIQTASAEIIKKLNNGEIDPLLLLARFKILEKVQENIKDLLRDYSNKESDKYSSTERKIGFEKHGFLYKQGEFGTKYDYSTSKDPLWPQLKKEADDANFALKQREEWLRQIKTSEILLNGETGEYITIYAPAKTSTTSTTVTIK